MHYTRIVAVLIIVAVTTACARSSEPGSGPVAYDHHVVPEILSYDDGGMLALERGVFFVPTDHDDPTSALLRLAFYRIAGDDAGPGATPLFVLAGGPGSTYFDDIRTVRFREWIEFYRAIGDIVILEQRGASESLPKPVCTSANRLPLDEPLRLDAVRSLLREQALGCAEDWRAAGLDVDHFTMPQMARDFDALRSALGYERFNLKGGSFGSQLGFTIIHEHPESVHRAVLYGIEGLDHTYDLPLHANRHVNRVAAEVAANPALSALIPDFRALLRGVLRRLETEPVRVSLEVPGQDKPVDVVLGATDVLLILWSQPLLQGYRSGIEKVPALLLAAHAGDYTIFAKAKYDALERWSTTNIMPYFVDCSSGISSGRKQRLPDADDTWIIPAEVIDYGLHAVCPDLGTQDLGDAFRVDRRSDVPIVMLSGSLDSFTAPENAEEIIGNYPNGHLLRVRRGDHSGWNMLAEFPELKSQIRDFLRGEPLPADFPDEVTMPELDFLIPRSPSGNR